MQPDVGRPQESPIHQLPQKLSAILIQLNTLQALVSEDMDEAALLSTIPDRNAIRDGLAMLEQMTREVLHDVRSAHDDIPLPELTGVTLTEALSRLVEETADTSGLSSRVSFSGEERTLPSSIERLLYLIAQEALAQVQQHTGARKLRFTFSYGRDNVQMTIEDDGTLPFAPGVGAQFIAPDTLPFAPGVGTPFIAPNAISPNAPIISDLRHRLEHLGGSLEVSTQVDQGTGTLWQARVPYVHHVHSNETPPTHNGTNVGAQFIAPATLAPAAITSDSLGHSTTPETSTPKERLRVLIVDSQAVTRAGLRRLIESYADLQVVGEAADGVQAVSETLELGPQVVLMDMQLPNEAAALEALRQIKHLNLDTRVLLLSAQDRAEYLYETLRAGADGYVLKDIVPDELAEAVRLVARGEVLVRATTRGRLAARDIQYEALTAREQEVLQLLARGLRNKEIAARLYVSERTVNFHLANIYQKLNVSGRTEALSKALAHGLVKA